ncbi:transferrin-binding protein-like solute binding protein [Maritimibacter fusiformis]|uniref:Transferrin-binding protein-like solute binding protein n=1 Tax=Maritimibacter fusiformis TaxID=2603819 RepID=A0A5D0RPH2_9RHOB|nr:transferrin-binding protein-like solute binding protein [Maritimibacter fusiformis]TYB82785.1 transferrin-binding protein-like solute binding protein [Maritimibacter fusiformis]
MRALISAAMLAALPGCVLTGIDPAGLGEKAGEMSALNNALPPGGDVETPQGGQAVYDGVASFYLQDGPNPQAPPVTGHAILGDARLTVDFGARTVGGVMDDFEVAEFLMADLDDDSFQNLENWEPATGQIVLANGTMVNTTRFDADFAGDLTTALHVYRLNGKMLGMFRGPNGEYILAHGDRDFGDNVTIDGETPLDGRFDLIAVTE